MDFKKLKGLTIQDVIVEDNSIHDDDPSIVLHMNNGSKYRIEGGYGEDTGESAHEFRTTLTLTSIKSSNLSNTIKKPRTIRLQYGNNVRQEYDNVKDLIKGEFDKLDYDTKWKIVNDLKLKI